MKRKQIEAAARAVFAEDMEIRDARDVLREWRRADKGCRACYRRLARAALEAATTGARGTPQDGGSRG